jgi:hypothetical protein
MRRRSRNVDQFEVRGVADRLLAYETAPSLRLEHDDAIEAELLERAVTLLTYLPRNQLREKVEKLLSPNDSQRARRAVDALIDAGFVTEDERGRLCRTGHLLPA